MRGHSFQDVTSLAASNACEFSAETPPLAGSGNGGVLGSSVTLSSRPVSPADRGRGRRAGGGARASATWCSHPTAGLHQVGPVAAGERLEAFGWVQSRVCDATRAAVRPAPLETGAEDAALGVRLGLRQPAAPGPPVKVTPRAKPSPVPHGYFVKLLDDLSFEVVIYPAIQRFA